MNPAKFLLLDGILVFLILPLILIIRGKKKELSFLNDPSPNKIIDSDSMTMPTLEKLLELEKLAKRDGSGIEYDSLIGLWRFVSVWKKNTDQEDSLSSSLLRMFSACLELKKNQLENTKLHEFGFFKCFFVT